MTMPPFTSWRLLSQLPGNVGPGSRGLHHSQNHGLARRNLAQHGAQGDNHKACKGEALSEDSSSSRGRHCRCLPAWSRHAQEVARNEGGLHDHSADHEALAHSRECMLVHEGHEEANLADVVNCQLGELRVLEETRLREKPGASCSRTPHGNACRTVRETCLTEKPRSRTIWYKTVFVIDGAL